MYINTSGGSLYYVPIVDQRLLIGKYKGCGRDKRLMSGKDKAIKDSNKRKNGCSKCGETNHNIKTCDREQERKKQKEQHDRMNSDLHVNNEWLYRFTLFND